MVILSGLPLKEHFWHIHLLLEMKYSPSSRNNLSWNIIIRCFRFSSMNFVLTRTKFWKMALKFTLSDTKQNKLGHPTVRTILHRYQWNGYYAVLEGKMILWITRYPYDFIKIANNEIIVFSDITLNIWLLS